MSARGFAYVGCVALLAAGLAVQADVKSDALIEAA